MLRKEGKSDDETLLEDLSKGSVKILLHGEKLKGEFALVKMKSAKEENALILFSGQADLNSAVRRLKESRVSE